MDNQELICRQRIKPNDLNACNRLFGGKLLSWIDEYSAIYAMCKLKTERVVTARVSEVNFKQPIEQGDILEFWGSIVDVGRASLTVRVIVGIVDLENPDATKVAADCQLVFVSVDFTGKPKAHNFKKEN